MSNKTVHRPLFRPGDSSKERGVSLEAAGPHKKLCGLGCVKPRSPDGREIA